jgi:hypothetical protein
MLTTERAARVTSPLPELTFMATEDVSDGTVETWIVLTA